MLNKLQMGNKMRKAIQFSPIYRSAAVKIFRSVAVRIWALIICVDDVTLGRSLGV